jgi:hypothetical protein
MVLHAILMDAMKALLGMAMSWGGGSRMVGMMVAEVVRPGVDGSIAETVAVAAVVRTTVANKALILDMADTILLELVLMRK